MAQNHTTKKILQFRSDFAEILAISPTHKLIILTNFDEHQTKIVEFLILVNFSATVIFLISL